MKKSHPLPDAVVIELTLDHCGASCVIDLCDLFILSGWVVEESHFQNSPQPHRRDHTSTCFGTSDLTGHAEGLAWQ